MRRRTRTRPVSAVSGESIVNERAPVSPGPPPDAEAPGSRRCTSLLTHIYSLRILIALRLAVNPLEGPPVNSQLAQAGSAAIWADRGRSAPGGGRFARKGGRFAPGREDPAPGTDDPSQRMEGSPQRADRPTAGAGRREQGAGTPRLGASPSADRAGSPRIEASSPGCGRNVHDSGRTVAERRRVFIDNLAGTAASVSKDSAVPEAARAALDGVRPRFPSFRKPRAHPANSGNSQE